MPFLRVYPLYGLDDAARLSVQRQFHTSQDKSAPNVFGVDVEILHGSSGGYNVWRLDMVGEDSGLVEATMEETVRRRKRPRRPGPDKSRQTASDETTVRGAGGAGAEQHHADSTAHRHGAGQHPHVGQSAPPHDQTGATGSAQPRMTETAGPVVAQDAAL